MQINNNGVLRAEIKVRMEIDPFVVVENALSCSKKVSVPKRVVSVDYDSGADVLYVKFRDARIVDNELLEAQGLVLASLDASEKIVGLVILSASKYAEKC